MRTTWALTLVALLFIGTSVAEVETATSAEDVSSFLDSNQDEIAALFFFDSSLNEGSEGGFWNGVVTSVSHIFNGEDTGVAPEHKVSELELRISEEADLLQIDVSNEDLRELQDQYEVTTIPYLIIYKKGIVVLSEVLNPETHDKVLQILNINPAAVHSEETSETTVVETPESAANAEEAAPVVTLAPGEKHPRPVEQQTKPQRVVQQRIAGNKATHTSSAKSGPIQEKCHDVTDPSHAHHNSAGYIAELEDFEIPEEWWEYGYSPITGDNAEEIHYSRNVQFYEPQNITLEPTEIVAPLVYNGPYFAPEIIVPEPVIREEFHAPHHYSGPTPHFRENVVAPVVVPEIISAPRPSIIQNRIAPNTVHNSTNVTLTQAPAYPVRGYPQYASRPVYETLARPAVNYRPTAAHARQVVAPTRPVAVSANATTKPVAASVNATAKPVVAPKKPAAAPAKPTPAPVKPTVAPTKPTKPVVAPAKPAAAPTRPVTTPVKPTPAPAKPVAAPTKPIAAPAKQVTAPVKQTVKPSATPTATAPKVTTRPLPTK